MCNFLKLSYHLSYTSDISLSRHAIQVTRSKTRDLCVNSTRRWLRRRLRWSEMRGIALRGIEASSVCPPERGCHWLSHRGVPFGSQLQITCPPAMPALPAGREWHDINQVVYVLNLRSWDPCQSCICVCGLTRHQCYKYWHSGISKPMLKELHPHGLMHYEVL